nr:MAG TPA: hypothetical protein [Caudoviricetes sp.]
MRKQLICPCYLNSLISRKIIKKSLKVLKSWTHHMQVN